MITKYVREYVKEKCNEAFSGMDMFEQHILVVSEYSGKLADILGADKEVVELAAYLHDFSVILDINTIDEHNVVSAELAEKILSEQNYPCEKISEVKHCILNHSSPIQIGKDTVEAICLSNSDAVSQIVKPAYWLYVSYGIWKSSYTEGFNSYKNWIDSNWEGLIKPARELIREKYQSVKACLHD